MHEIKNKLPKTESEWVEMETKRQWKDNQEMQYGKWAEQSKEIREQYQKEIANITLENRKQYFDINK